VDLVEAGVLRPAQRIDLWPSDSTTVRHPESLPNEADDACQNVGYHRPLAS